MRCSVEIDASGIKMRVERGAEVRERIEPANVKGARETVENLLLALVEEVVRMRVASEEAKSDKAPVMIFWRCVNCSREKHKDCQELADLPDNKILVCSCPCE